MKLKLNITKEIETRKKTLLEPCRGNNGERVLKMEDEKERNGKKFLDFGDLQQREVGSRAKNKAIRQTGAKSHQKESIYALCACAY